MCDSCVDSAAQSSCLFSTVSPRFPPEQTREFYGWAGKTVNVTCETLAEPAPAFRWYHNGREIKESNETFRLIHNIKNHVLQVR